MKRLTTTLILAALALSPFAYAGVVMDMVIQDAAGMEEARAKLYAQDGMIRMDELGGEDGDVSMIFLGDRMLVVDHDEKSYMVMDEEMIEGVSAQIDQAMAELEKQLAGMPPEQRAMVEQMMKGQMQDMMPSQSAPRPAPRVESIGRGKWQSYDCERFAVFEGDEKIQEVCAADLDDIDGADEAMKAFQRMGEFIMGLAESMPMMADQDFNPGELMDEFNGFPVHTKEFEGGKVVAQSSLESVTQKDLGPEMFAAPDGYLRQDPFAR